MCTRGVIVVCVCLSVCLLPHYMMITSGIIMVFSGGRGGRGFGRGGGRGGFGGVRAVKTGAIQDYQGNKVTFGDDSD